MPRAVKFALVLVALILCFPILFVGFYELHDFRPYLPRVNAIYNNMAAEDKEPPSNVQYFVEKVEGDTVDSFASRELLGEIRGPERMAVWHYHLAMWELLLRVHFSKAKRIAFYCHYLRYEGGSGLSNASQFYFGRQPEKLSLDEIAAIVAIGRSPNRNSPTRHPENLETAKKRLLDAYASVH